jgi:predicted GIY-YIG superfamily endonuclease
MEILEKEKEFFVYLLMSTDHCTYVGATVDLDHRLRQHNKEIKGGAVQTSRKVNQGQTWERVCYVSGFPTWQAALQFEWRWKQISRQYKGNMAPLKKRFLALHQLLNLKQSTSKAVPYEEWPSPPKINFTKPETEIDYTNIINQTKKM